MHPILADCIRVHGEQYDGERTIGSNGEKCLNWLNVTRGYNAADYTNNNTGRMFTLTIACCMHEPAASVVN